MKPLGTQIRDRRVKLHLSGQEVARRAAPLGRTLNAGTLSKIEHDRHDPSLGTLIVLSSVLDCEFRVSRDGPVLLPRLALAGA